MGNTTGAMEWLADAALDPADCATDYYESLGYTTTNSSGALSAKVTASTDRYWRYYFTGTMTTNAVKAAGDYVDVRQWRVVHF